MATIIFTYSPRPGVPLEEFERFLREVDQPATLSNPSVIGSRILRINDEEAPFRYLELLEVRSFEEWERDTDPALRSPEEQKRAEEVLAQWEKLGDIAGLKRYYVDEIFTSEKE